MALESSDTLMKAEEKLILMNYNGKYYQYMGKAPHIDIAVVTFQIIGISVIVYSDWILSNKFAQDHMVIRCMRYNIMLSVSSTKVLLKISLAN